MWHWPKLGLVFMEALPQKQVEKYLCIEYTFDPINTDENMRLLFTWFFDILNTWIRIFTCEGDSPRTFGFSRHFYT